MSDATPVAPNLTTLLSLVDDPMLLACRSNPLRLSYFPMKWNARKGYLVPEFEILSLEMPGSVPWETEDYLIGLVVGLCEARPGQRARTLHFITKNTAGRLFAWVSVDKNEDKQDEWSKDAVSTDGIFMSYWCENGGKNHLRTGNFRKLRRLQMRDIMANRCFECPTDGVNIVYKAGDAILK